MLVFDPYEVLGVQRASSAAEVTSAYESLAAIFTPSRWADSPDLEREAQAWSERIDVARRALLAG